MGKIKHVTRIIAVISALLLPSVLSSCDFFADGEKNNESEKNQNQISAIRLTASQISTQVGGIQYLGFVTVPSYSISPEWTYDPSVIEIEKQSNGIVIKGIAEGQCAVTCSYQGRSATAIVTVSGFSENYIDTTEPYIYSDTTILQMRPNDRETIHVSLYNGTAADQDGYTWLIENPAVANIAPTGQYCAISTLSQGYTRIKVTHNKSPYPYYIGVYVFDDDITKVTFITTKNNITKLNTTQGEKNISVSLANPKSEDYARHFSWQIIDGNEYLEITSNGADCVLIPVAAGDAHVRITHPEAEYPLDVTVRIVEIVENVYVDITPKADTFTLSGTGTNTGSISATLIGLSEGKDYSNDDFYFEVIQDESSFGEDAVIDWQSFSNNITFTGIHDGAAVIYIGHPKAAKKRQVLIITENQTIDAVDASCMLSTTQDYIKTKVGADDIRLTVSLKGADEDDNKNFLWSIRQQPADGTSDVIELVTTDGTAASSRMAAQTYTYGTAYIKPLAVGYATITVTNTKSYYPLEILVKVLDEYAVLEEQYYFTGDGIVKFLNSETYEYTATLRSAPESEKSKISWESDSTTLNINANGEKALLSSTATGNAVSHITVNHPNAQSPKEVLVLNADTQEELDAMKAFYANKTYYSVNVESTVDIHANSVGFTDENDEKEFDFSAVAAQVQWFSSDPTIASVEKNEDWPLSATVSGNKTGTAKITLSYGSVSATFTVTVYPKGVEIGQVEKTVYLTTMSNVVILNNKESKSITVSAIGLQTSKYSDIKWTVDDESVASVIGNGTSATITARAEGETTVTVSHPDSENELRIHVRVGSEYVMPEAESSSSVPQISVPNVITMITGEASRRLTATIANLQGADTAGFTFACDNERVAALAAQSTNGTAYVKPMSAGYAEITVSHRATSVTKKVLAVVGKSEEEIKAALAKDTYLTTKNNAVAIAAEGERAAVKVTAANLSEQEQLGITWTSTDESVASVIGNGASATITANGGGTALIYATHEKSLNAVTFHVFVGTKAIQEASTPAGDTDPNDPSSGGSSGTGGSTSGGGTSGNGTGTAAGISSASVVTLATGDADRQLAATLTGYAGTDTDGFTFSIRDEKVAKISSQSTNGTAYVRPVAAGYTEITISHRATDATKKVLVVVGNTEEAAAQTLSQLAYLTTGSNVLFLSGAGSRGTLSLTANNMAAWIREGIRWTSADEKVATVIGNGASATVIANSTGKTTVTASHADSQNTLTFYVYTGNNAATADQSNTSKKNSVTHISTTTDSIVMLTDTPNYALTAVLVNPENSDDGLTGFTFSVDNSAVAKIITSYPTGSCYLKPVSAGQAEITVSHPKAAYPKKVLVIVENTEEEIAEIKHLSTTANVVNVSEKSTRSVSVTLENATETVVGGFTWSSADESIASVLQTTAGTALISGNKIGTTKITVTHAQTKYPLDIIVQVVDPVAAAATPFIQVPTPILNLVESTSWQTLTAELVGGTDADAANFNWQVYDGIDTVDLYAQNGIAKIRAKKAGSAIVRVSHPKAVYPQDIRIICDAASTAEYSISVSSGNVMSIRPDAGDQTITATLVNGSSTDKYNFRWSLDVFDVIDLTYSANTAIITPLKEGTAMLTVSHPKAAFDQQIVIKVQQYSTFGFSVVSKTVVAGQSTFITMQVPASSEKTKVSYYSDNEEVVGISGTAAVCQITGRSANTATVHAQLISERSLAVLATADMLVIVTPASENLTYIADTSGNPTTFSMTLGTSKIISAEVVGEDITVLDRNNMVWSVGDNNVLTLAGADTEGKAAGTSAYITAAKAGETTLTVTHPKTSFALVYHVIVPGAEAVEVSLDKNYVSLEKGKNTTVKATVSTKKNSDYQKLIWEISRLDGDEIATVNGTGQTVTLYALKAGAVWLTCKYPSSENGTVESIAQCQVVVTDPKSLLLKQSVIRVQPNQSKTFEYTVSPADAAIDWVWTSSTTDASDIFSFVPHGHNAEGNGTVTVTGMKEGTAQLTGITSYGNKAAIQVQVAWDYKFQLSTTSVGGTPDKDYMLTYTVNPADAEIEVDESSLYDAVSHNNFDGTGTVTFTPKTEGTDTVRIRATNPATGEEIGEKSVKVSFAYGKLTPKITFRGSDGVWSNWNEDANALTIGDGENVSLSFAIAEEKASATIKGVSFNPTQGSPVSLYAGTDGNTYVLSGGEDVKTMQYRIEKAYVPVYVAASSQTEEVIASLEESYETTYKFNGSTIRLHDLDYSPSSSGTEYYASYGRYVENSGSDRTVERELRVWRDYDYDDDTYYTVREVRITTTPTKQEELISWQTDLFWYAKDYDDDDSFTLLSSRYSKIDSTYSMTGFLYGARDRLSRSSSVISDAFRNYTGDSQLGTLNYSCWTKKLDPTLTGKTYGVDEFKSIAWFYCPGTPAQKTSTAVTYPNENKGGFGGGATVNVDEGMMTDNVSAVLETSTDDSAKSTPTSGLAGFLEVEMSNNSEPSRIPVYLEVRYCDKTYKKP